MLLKSNAARLATPLRGVETMTRFALAVLSLASGVYTYLGVRGLLDGSPTFVFFGAIIYAAAVSVAIYAFWTFFLRFMPLVTGLGRRLLLFLVMVIGCLHDHGDVVLAKRRGPRRLRRAGAAPCRNARRLCRRPRRRPCQRAGEPEPAARRAARQRPLRQARRRRTGHRRPFRHHRLGQRRRSSSPRCLHKWTSWPRPLPAARTRSQQLFDEGSQHLKAMRDLLSAGGEIGAALRPVLRRSGAVGRRDRARCRKPASRRR